MQDLITNLIFFILFINQFLIYLAIQFIKDLAKSKKKLGEGEEILEILSLPPEQRNDNHINKLKSFCHNLSYFEKFESDNQEDQDKQNMFLKHMRIQQNKKNDHIFDIYGKPVKYFVVVEGKINIYQKLMLPNPSPDEQLNQENSVQTLKEDLIYNGMKLSLLQTKGKGDSIGMIDLIYKRNYQLAAICQTDCIFLTITNVDFQKYLKDFEHKNMMKTIQFLAQIPHFSNQSFGYLRDIAVNSNHLINLRGDVIYQENQNADSVYIIKSGEYAVGCFIIKAVVTSPIEKIIQDNILQQGGPLFLGSPKVKKDLKLKIMTQYEIFGEEDIIKGNQTRNHSVVCESRKAECYQISTNLFIQKVIDLQSTRATFSEIQKNKQISTGHQDQGNKTSIKYYKSFYFEEKQFQDLSPQRMQNTSPVNESFDRSPGIGGNRDLNFSVLMNDVKKQNDKLPKINVIQAGSGGSGQVLNYTLSQPQLTKTNNTNGNDSQEDINQYQEQIPIARNSQVIISSSRLNEENKLKKEENEIAFTETNGIRKLVQKKKQLKLHLRKNSKEQRSTSLFTENNRNDGSKILQANGNQQKVNSRILFDNDTSFGVDNIKDLQKIITTSHVKNELSQNQPKDQNSFGRMSLQKNYERSLKEKPKEIKQVYTFELDEKERQKVIIRKQKYRNYIHDWKKSPSPPQSIQFDEAEDVSRKTYLSKNQLKAMQETVFQQKLEKNKNKIDQLNSNSLLSTFYHYPDIQNSLMQPYYNSKSNNPQLNSQSVNTSINYKDKQDNQLQQSSFDFEQNSIIQSLQHQRTKSPLAMHLLEQSKQQISLMQDYVCTQIIETPQQKDPKTNIKQFAIPISKQKEKEDQYSQQPFLSYRGNGSKNQIYNLWKQKIQNNSERRRNAKSQMEQNLSARRNDMSNGEIHNFMISSQTSIKYVNDEQNENRNKQRSRIHELSITPNYFKQTVDQSINQSLADQSIPFNQSDQSQYRLASILTTQSRGKRKKVANSVDLRAQQNKTPQNQQIILSSLKNENSKVGVIISVAKKQSTNQGSINLEQKNNQDYGSDPSANYQLKPIYKV